MLKFLETDFMTFQSQLNPALWEDKHLRPEVRSKLLIIAKYFQEKLEITQKPIDIYFTGSLANYNYNESSDIDLHLVFDFDDLGDLDFIEDYFKTKKKLFNAEHEIFIKGYPVEVSVENIDTPGESSAVYSVKNDKWVIEPQPITAKVEDVTTTESWIKLLTEIRDVLKRNDPNEIEELWHGIKDMRKAGLKIGGELHPYNLLFKELRRRGIIEVIKNRLTKLTDNLLSLNELDDDFDDDDDDKYYTTKADWAEWRKQQEEIAKTQEAQRQAEYERRKNIKAKNKQRRLEQAVARYQNYLNHKDEMSYDEQVQMEREFNNIRDPQIKAAIHAEKDKYYERKHTPINILKGRL